jgi:hypothetical protein
MSKRHKPPGGQADELGTQEVAGGRILNSGLQPVHVGVQGVDMPLHGGCTSEIVFRPIGYAVQPEILGQATVGHRLTIRATAGCAASRGRLAANLRRYAWTQRCETGRGRYNSFGIPVRLYTDGPAIGRDVSASASCLATARFTLVRI